MIRRLDPSDKQDYEVMSAFAQLSLSPHWEAVSAFLHSELYRLDVLNRTAEPYLSTRLGASADTLARVLDKFTNSLDRLAENEPG